MEFFIIIICAYLVIAFIMAEKMQEVAEKKGYDSNKSAWHLSFWLGIIGYIYVIALPDLKAQKAQEEIADILKLVYAEEIKEEETRKENARLAAETEKVRLKEAKLREQEEQRKAYESRVEAYWNLHAEEKEILLQKKAQAEEKIKELGAFAGKEKEELEEIVKTINFELKKDREI